MACGNSLSGSDVGLIQASAQAPASTQMSTPAAHVPAARVAAALADDSDPAHESLADAVMENAAGNESIPEAYKEDLAQAVSELIELNPSMVGLVSRDAREKGTTSLQTTLAHSTRGAGFAAEAITASALIGRTSQSTKGQALTIDPKTDQVNLGTRAQARYEGAQAELPGQPDRPGQPTGRGTVEADIHISRSDPVMGYVNIGIDSKHSANAGVYSAGIAATQLSGVVTAIATGELNEFHFVTNGTFPNATKDAIEAANQQLVEMDNPPSIHCHEGVWR